ncbi:MAG TPA: biotin/lipoyl-binding protein, partial [Opitutaceae bacterium]|nr:biotin/lipoyl-binding protein [Opitutaceae bacterium]
MQIIKNSRPPADIARAVRPALLGLIAVAVLAAGCGRTSASAGRGAAVPVQIGTATRQDLPIAQSSIGAVQSLRTVIVKSQVDGVIAQIHFREGAEVAAGDLLITLDRR